MEHILTKFKELIKTNTKKDGKGIAYVELDNLTKVFNSIHNEIITSKKNYENELSAHELRCQAVEKDNMDKFHVIKILTEENKILKSEVEKIIKTPKSDFRMTISYYEEQIKKLNDEIAHLREIKEEVKQSNARPS